MSLTGLAQQCPPNLGFEEGSFNHWDCFTGKIDTQGVVKVNPATPETYRHTLFKKTDPPILDPYGAFPITCPNGGGYSIMLGNEDVGAQAERVSYTFAIPAGQNEFSIVYNYAVVFQNPSHQRYQQPRFTSKIFDVTANQYIECSSFDYAASSSLPGFKQVGSTDVFYKPWSPVTIKLSGYAGKTIRLEFTTNDCTRGGHFGYAYVDVNQDCGLPIKGNISCAGSSSLTLTAPFGFQEYTWFDSTVTQQIGTGSILKLSPSPVAGTKLALQIIPYPGSGCTDTLYTTITGSPVPLDFRLADSVASCTPEYPDLTSPTITTGSTPGLEYGYFADSSQQEYISTPARIQQNGIYYIKAVNAVGCYDIKPIKVIISESPNVKVLDPPPAYFPATVDITDSTLLVNGSPALNFSYWTNATATIPVADPKMIATAGYYFIKAINKYGCSNIYPVFASIVPPPPPNVFSPNGDGINDTWQINGLQPYPGCTVDIFDRYGQHLFHSAGYNTPWDGIYKGRNLPMGTYYYVIYLSPRLKRMGGNVTILR